MPAHLSHPFIFLAVAVVSVSSNSAVMEIKISYPCCNLTITFDPNCENSWNIKDEAFAYANSMSNQCILPCLKIEGGRMTLDRCAEVNATVVCADEMNVASEKRVCYYGEPCSGSVSKAGNQGWIGVLVALVALAIIAGSIVTCVKCVRSRNQTPAI